MVTEGDMDVQWMIKDSFFLSTLVVFEEKNVVTKVGEAWQEAESCKADQGDLGCTHPAVHRPQHLRAEQPQKS